MSAHFQNSDSLSCLHRSRHALVDKLKRTCQIFSTQATAHTVDAGSYLEPECRRSSNESLYFLLSLPREAAVTLAPAMAVEAAKVAGEGSVFGPTSFRAPRWPTVMRRRRQPTNLATKQDFSDGFMKVSSLWGVNATKPLSSYAERVSRNGQSASCAGC